MGDLDQELLAERTATVRRHIRRVEERLPALAERLARAAGFRNLLVDAYADLDLHRVHAAAADGPDDLMAFLARLRDQHDTH